MDLPLWTAPCTQLRLVFKPVALGRKVQLGISTGPLRLSLTGLVDLLYRETDFSWHGILPVADATNTTLSLYDALLKVYQSHKSGVELDRWIAGFFATLHLEDSNVTTELNRLYTTLLHDFRSISSSPQAYDDLATICLLVKDLAPASLVADILGIPFVSLKHHIVSTSLNALFVVPAEAERPLRLGYQLPMQLVIHDGPLIDLHDVLQSAKLARIKASLCGAILKAFQSKSS